MAKLVLTAIGDDREGLVSALARVVERHGGNWLDSQFAHLAGKFAGLVLVELEDSRSDALEAAVADLLDSVGWKIEVSPAVTDDLVGQAPESGT
jgi:glycine cleavage system regulatory protein